MVNCRISPDRKLCALNLWDHGWEIEDICFALMISRSSLYRWRQIFAEHGSVTRPQTSIIGPKRIINRAVLTAIQDIYKEDSDLYLDELCILLAADHQITVSKSTLSRNLIEAGLTRKVLHKLAIERDEALRQDWINGLQNDFSGDGSEFVCVDETSKNDITYARRYGRSMSGEPAFLTDVFARGDRYSLIAAITTDGYIAAHAVPGSFDAFEFYDFIAEDVLPQMNPFPAEHSVLVLDNCRIHHNDAIAELVRTAGCLILYLPAYSPDLNPIEESFSTFKAFIRRHGHILRQTVNPVGSLLEACSCITAEMCKGWFKHAGYIL